MKQNVLTLKIARKVQQQKTYKILVLVSINRNTKYKQKLQKLFMDPSTSTLFNILHYIEV